MSVLGVTKVLEAGPPPTATWQVRILIAIIGLVATAGLFIYDVRNSQFHDDLIGRGRRIEHELGVDTGLFRGRLRYKHWVVQHDVATGLVYLASFAGWILAIAAIWFGWAFTIPATPTGS